MSFDLDVIHLASNGLVVKIDEHVSKHRLSFARGGSSVVEIRAGLSASMGLECGDFLGWSNE